MIYVVVSDMVLPETQVLGFECDIGLEVKLNKASTIYFLSDFWHILQICQNGLSIVLQHFKKIIKKWLKILAIN